MKFFIIKTLGVTPVNPQNPKFSISTIKNYMLKKHIPAWRFGIVNAQLVIEVHAAFSNIFSMLTSVGFEDDLCLFKYSEDISNNMLFLTDNCLKEFNFFKLDLSQQSYFNKYVDKNMSYIQFVRSSFFYWLSLIFKNKSEFDLSDKLELDRFLVSFAELLYVNSLASETLFQDLKNLNFFYLYPLECVKNFNKILEENLFGFKEFEHCTFSEIEAKYRMSRFLHSFPFYFSIPFCFECLEDCKSFNSMIPLLLALKVYELKLIAFNNQSSQDECNQNFLTFKNMLFYYEFFSEKKLDFLVQKNFKYYNYE